MSIWDSGEEQLYPQLLGKPSLMWYWLRGLPVGMQRKKVLGREIKTTAVETGGASLVYKGLERKPVWNSKPGEKVAEEVWEGVNVRSRSALLAIEAARG